MRYHKPFLTIEEQLELLISRGMKLESKESVSSWLSTHNYYRLRAYWLPFEERVSAETTDCQAHSFRTDTNFEMVIALYELDEKLRRLMFSGIQRLELAVRATLAHAHAKFHGAHGYLEQASFHNNDSSALSDWHSKFISGLVTDCRHSKEIFIRHYQEKYDEPALPPIWVAVEIMTLGTLSHFYKQSTNQVKVEVANKFGLPRIFLDNYLHHFSVIRNLCAHHSRLWNRILSVTPRIPEKSQLIDEDFLCAMNRETIPKPDKNSSPQARIYNSALILSYLLRNVSSIKCWREECFLVLNEITENATRALPSSFDLEKKMGFPERWRNLNYWTK